MQDKKMSAALMLCMGLMAGSAFAKVPAAEADKLGKELTCTGAIKAGNADGSIPAFTGKILGVPPGVKFTKSVGQFLSDIYANEKAGRRNHGGQYGPVCRQAQRWPEGAAQALPHDHAHPRLPGSPRRLRYDDEICAVIKRNALEAESRQ